MYIYICICKTFFVQIEENKEGSYNAVNVP